MTAALVHNGGRTQVNMNFVGAVSGEWPFLDLMKAAGTPRYVTALSGVTAMDPREFDSSGYATTIHAGSGGYYWITQIPTQAERAGNYVITWDGVGTIFVGGTNTLVSGSKTNSSGSGRYVFTPDTNGGSYNVGVQSMSAQITNIKFYHISDETDILAGKLIGAKQAAKLREAGYGVYRFLTWQYGDSTNLTTWATRTPATYATWGGQYLRQELFCPTLSNSGDDWSVTGNGLDIPASGAPSDKMTLSIQFNASKTYAKQSNITFTIGTSRVNVTAHGLSANAPVGFGGTTLPGPIFAGGNYFVVNPTTNDFQVSLTSGGAAITLSGSPSADCFMNRQPTLALNGTTAYPIKELYGSTIGTSSAPASGRYATLMFDAALGSWLMNGGSSTGGDVAGYRSGVPYEIMLQYCAEMGTHPWFVMPLYATDPHTDFAAGLAAYCKANAPAWMIPRYEGCNELWNTNAPEVLYASNKACTYGWFLSGGNVGDYHNWMGKTMSILGQDLAGVYGGTIDGTKYHAIVGVFTPGFSSPTNGQNARFDAALYVTQTGNSADAAYKWLTHATCHHYIRPVDYGTGQETTYATAWNGGDTTAISSYLATLNTGTSSQGLCLAVLNACYTNLFAKAQSYTNKDGFKLKMCGYEGGMSLDYTGGGVSTVDLFRAACKANSMLVWATLKNYDNFVAAGGEWPSRFQFGGPTPSGNAWSILEDLYQSYSPQFDGDKLYNARQRRLSVKN